MTQPKWEPLSRYCSAGRAGVLLRDALKGTKLLLSEEDDDFADMAFVISMCMTNHDQDTDIPILQKELDRARGSILHLRGLLDKIKERTEPDRKIAADKLAESEDSEQRAFWMEELDSHCNFQSHLKQLNEGLEPYLEFFHVDLVKPDNWHVYALKLFDALTTSVPSPYLGKPWGLSPDGPAVRFIQKALEDILIFRKSDGTYGHTKQSGESIVAAVSKQRRSSQPRT